MVFLTEQYSIGAIEFIKRLIQQKTSNLMLLKEIDQRSNRHIITPTWGSYGNSTTTYYQ